MDSIRTSKAPASALRGCARFAGALLVALTCLLFAPVAIAAQHETLVISTEKPLGPTPGTFSTSGAFVDAGVMTTERRVVSALPAPFGVATHLVLRFDGEQGSFTVRAELIESVTDDPDVFANSGVWAVIDGNGAYAKLHGTGAVEGSVDDAANLIVRVFVGEVVMN